MTVQPKLIDDAQPQVFGETLAQDIRLVEDPHHQGIPLIARDYVALVLVTVAVPVLITILAGVLA